MGILETIALIPISALLLIVLSQYIIFLFPKKKFTKEYFPPISILVPAHNEGEFLEGTINALLKARYDGRKEIIVIDDGSTDNTPNVIRDFVRQKKVKAVRTNHIGKSKALNKALKLARNEIVVVVDGDSELEENALTELVKPFKNEEIGAVSGIIKVKNREESIFTWFQNLEYLYFSFFRTLCDRIGGSIFTPGPISAYRKSFIKSVGGFSTRTYMEDVDISLKFHRHGYELHVQDSAISRTVVPSSFKKWISQRIRWARGGIQITRANLDFFFNKSFAGASLYSLPIMTYWYFHSLLMGTIIFYQIFSGYYSYFFMHGDVFSFSVLRYFVYWLSLFGIINLSYQILVGAIQPTAGIVLSIIITALTYGLYLYSITKYGDKITFREVFVLIFYFPYCLIVLAAQVCSILELFNPAKKIKWKK